MPWIVLTELDFLKTSSKGASSEEFQESGGPLKAALGDTTPQDQPSLGYLARRATDWIRVSLAEPDHCVIGENLHQAHTLIPGRHLLLFSAFVEQGLCIPRHHKFVFFEHLSWVRSLS